MRLGTAPTEGTWGVSRILSGLINLRKAVRTWVLGKVPSPLAIDLIKFHRQLAQSPAELTQSSRGNSARSGTRGESFLWRHLVRCSPRVQCLYRRLPSRPSESPLQRPRLRVTRHRPQRDRGPRERVSPLSEHINLLLVPVPSRVPPWDALPRAIQANPGHGYHFMTVLKFTQNTSV